jgi:uncharacterized protein (DUF488 family)
VIYSIGYAGRTIAEFLGLLRQYEIEFLIDVRSQPYSKRYPDFARDALRQHITSAGMKYVVMGVELGGRPADPDCYAEDGRVDYAKVRQKAFYRAGIERLVKAHEGGYPAAIMCAEIKPEECHRSRLIGATLRDLNIPLLHITETGSLKTQDEVLPRQLNLLI